MLNMPQDLFASRLYDSFFFFFYAFWNRTRNEFSVFNKRKVKEQFDYMYVTEEQLDIHWWPTLPLVFAGVQLITIIIFASEMG